MPRFVGNIKLCSSAVTVDTSSPRHIHTHTHTQTYISALGYYLWSGNGVRKTAADPVKFSTQSRLWTRPF